MTKIGRFGLNALVVLIALFLILPTLIVIPMSFTSGDTLVFPPPGFSTRWYHELLDDPTWIRAFGNSLKVAVLTAICATVLGTAAALGIHRGHFPGKALVSSLVGAPLVMPYVVIGIALYAIFLRWGLTASLAGFVLAHTVLAIPYVIMTLTPLLRGLDRNLEFAAASLGAPPFTAFRKIVLPALVPAMVTGAFFSFIISFDEVVVAIFLGGAGFETLPVRMWSGVRVSIDPSIAAVATVLVVTSTLILFAGLISRTYLSRASNRRSQKVTA